MVEGEGGEGEEDEVNRNVFDWRVCGGNKKDDFPNGPG